MKKEEDGEEEEEEEEGCVQGARKGRGELEKKITEKYRESGKKERGSRLQEVYGGRGRMLGRVK